MADLQPDVKLAYETLAAKQLTVRWLWDYYDGNHPLRYSASRLASVFQNADARFVQNWCAVVIDALLDRLTLKRFTVNGDDQATAELNRLWAETEMTLDDVDAHKAALVAGESFIVAWRDEDSGETQAYYHDADLCHVFYSAQNPHRKRMACKWWIDDDGLLRLQLYYPDRFEYYVSAKKAARVESFKALLPADPPMAENPFGEIPVFHLRRERRAIKSELANATPIQDAINKMLSDMMVAAEFGAFKQRWIISNSDISDLKNAPNEVWNIPAGDGVSQGAQVGEFGEANLGQFMDAIDRLAASMAIITRTPKHYFFSQGGDPSGEALIAMEAPLNRRAGQYIEHFSATWRELAAFLLRLNGREVERSAIEPIYDRPETVQPRTQAEIRQMSVGAGMPLRTVLRDEGWSDQQLEQLDADRAEESAATANSFGAAMAEAARRSAQGGEV